MRGGERADAGSATVLVLALVTVLAAVAGVLVCAGALVVARHRADSAADLAALAAAARALDGAPAACRAAEGVARAGGAALTGCRVQGEVAVVTVEVVPPGGLGRLGTARTTARAGPASGTPEAF